MKTHVINHWCLGAPCFKGITHSDGPAALGISSRGPESERGLVLGEGLLTSLWVGKGWDHPKEKPHVQ